VAGSPSEHTDILGLTGIRAKPPERTSIRTRTSNVTLSAWRLEIVSDQGNAAIVLVEGEAERALYRGEGALLGWSQERLAAAYRALLPGSDGPDLETPQLG
jgi:hypothetical protein